MNSALAQYSIVTASYWAFTLTDGALRMLVVLYFHQLGYSPLEVATLFVLYEFFGIVTNLFGGWLAAHWGLNMTMQLGLALQIVALLMLMVEPSLLTVAYVMVAQAVSGIAKDLNKMSAKSSIKLLLPDDAQGQLYKWVAILTGSKNTLKGAGFFMGSALLALVGFRAAVASMAVGLAVVLVLNWLLLQKDLGKTRFKPKFRELLSKSPAINRLSGARFFLFGARDVWFVVALPVYLQAQLGWGNVEVGSYLALWVIGYGFVQTLAPRITGLHRGVIPDGKTAFLWSLALCLIPALIALFLTLGLAPGATLIPGLLIFGAVFAINSSVHSFLIISYARTDGVSLDVGFYYMANAAGRLLGTLLSGLIYQQSGMIACLLTSSALIAACSIISARLPEQKPQPVPSSRA